MNLRFYIFLIVMGLTIFSSNVFADITSAGSGNWSAPGTWVNNIVPSSTDNVIIAAGHTVNIDDGTATCNNISFLATTSHLTMGTAASVLSVYGNFTIFSTAHSVFSSTWTAGAKIVFTGSAATQTLSGWNTSFSTYYSTSFMEMQVNKSAGKVVTSGTGMILCIGTSLEIINGTFELASTDNIMAVNLSNTATIPTFTVDAGGTFNMVGSSSGGSGGGIRRGTYTLGDNAKIGLLTVFGIANLAGGTRGVNFSGVSIENGGLVEIPTSRNIQAGVLNLGTITVKSGGIFKNDVTTLYWYVNGTTSNTLVINSGGEFNSASGSVTPLPQVVTPNDGSTVRFSSNSGSALPAAITTYSNLYLSGTGANVKTLSTNIVVNGSLEFLGSATLSLGAFTLTYGASAELQYGASGQLTPQTTSDAEWPASNGPLNVQVYNSGGVTLHADRTVPGNFTLTLGQLNLNGKQLIIPDGSTISRAKGTLSAAPVFPLSPGMINLKYTSTTLQVTTDYEMPVSTSTLNNLTISSSMGVVLGSNVTVNGTLSLSGSCLTLGSFNLTLIGPLTGNNSSRYIITNGSGLLIQNVGNSQVTFPVGYGPSDYTPLTFSNGGTAQNYNVRVIPVIPNLITGGLGRQWFVQETTNPASTVLNSLMLQWNGNADVQQTLLNTSPCDFVANTTGGTDSYNVIQSGLSISSSSASISTPYTLGDISTSGLYLTALQTDGNLPVELSSFQSIINGRNIQLNWETKTEKNYNKFEIESTSLNNSNWQSIGSVKASGSSNSPKKYSFTERNLQAGKFQYRLKMIDNDGTFEYSKVLIADISLPKDFELGQNYPNPFNPTTKITYQLPVDSRINLELFDITGKRVAVLVNQDESAGYYTLDVHSTGYSNNLTSGVYIYRITVTEKSSGIMYSTSKKMSLLK